ncbi:MAG: polymer-forming cytoskeletal protein [Candidatus Symbiothrix sp.]|jgi:cytoskeletal protein CcmA (bactofilin family)|nr:polymer-forming cytoskeletal protein [Candidatus Symbiothrix sp.]
MKNHHNATGMAHNALATGTLVKGNITAEEDFRIDGKIEGSVDCSGKLVIGPQAEITGDIHCYNLDVFGKIKGNLVVRETLNIKSSGNIVGELIVGQLSVESGAFLNGFCKMS